MKLFIMRKKTIKTNCNEIKKKMCVIYEKTPHYLLTTFFEDAKLSVVTNNYKKGELISI